MGSTLPTGRTAARARTPAADPQDLDVSLDALSPSVLPKSGAVTMRGTVTNTTSDPLTGVNVHPLTSYSPMTSASDIEVSVESDPEIYIGSRIVTSGLFDSVGDLAAGQTAGWRVRVPVSELEITGEEGVYWIGVQVLAADETGARDDPRPGPLVHPADGGQARRGADLRDPAGTPAPCSAPPTAGSAAPTCGPTTSTPAGGCPTSPRSSAPPAPRR